MIVNKRDIYRMPVFFGPGTSPRRGPDGTAYDGNNGYNTMMYSAGFLSDAKQLSEFLPARFALSGEPVVTVFAQYIKDIEWLAGRGYNLLGVTIPVVYSGVKETVCGNLLLVMWENLTEPILTGREELGFSKIFCDIPEPMNIGNDTYLTANWMGFKFFDFSLKGLRPPTAAERNPAPKPGPENQGLLHYRYLPRIGDWGKAEVEQVALTPLANPEQKILNMWKADAEIAFHKTTWRDMPTQYMIVNALAGLEIKKMLGATILQTQGYKDLSDQRVLE